MNKFGLIAVIVFTLIELMIGEINDINVVNKSTIPYSDVLKV